MKKPPRSARSRTRVVINCLLLFLAVFACFALAFLASFAVYNWLEGLINRVVAIIVTAICLVVIALVATSLLLLCLKIFIKNPLDDILSATESIAKGNYNVTIPARHPWGEYDSYDAMADNLNRMAEELSRSESRHADFIANVSHEIKTPLAVIQSYAVALKAETDENTRKSYCDILEASSARLTALVTNILKLNKLENQSIFPEKAEVDVAEQLRVCILAFEDRIEQKGLALECDIEECVVYSDGGLLEIIWNNLLSNAVKFTDEGKITVTMKGEDGGVSVCVRDTGCGISRESGVHIFDKFYQGDTSHSREGNGLGLALVKRVIDILGGEISVDSRTGEGTAFTVRIKNGNI